MSQENSIATALHPHEGGVDASWRQLADGNAIGATTEEATLAEGADRGPLSAKVTNSAASASGTNLAERSRNNPSSNYPSVMPSFEPSPADSTANGLSLSPQDIENLELSPFHCKLRLILHDSQIY